MDAQQFDAITRAWTRLPRRRVLGGLVAGALGPLLGWGGQEASAISTTCRRSRNCPTGQVCVHRTCTLTCTDPLICLNGQVFGGTGCPLGSFCAQKPGGGGICLRGGAGCVADLRCKKQRDCPVGTICGSGCCDPKFTCSPPSVG